MKTLYVTGRHDGVERRVEHLPINTDMRETRTSPAHYLMHLHTSNGIVRTSIAESRIQSRTETRYGIGQLSRIVRDLAR